MQNPMARVLFSDGRSPEIPEADDIYGWLIGRWAAEVRDYEGDGSVIVGRGEWTFGRVLEGRAIQDVWIAPAPDERPVQTGLKAHVRNRYGSSLRYFDRTQRAWKVIWVNPVTGICNELVGRMVDGRIVQMGSYAGRAIRWNFNDIEADSFRWTGESLAGDGTTWRLEAEFLAKRMD